MPVYPWPQRYSAPGETRFTRAQTTCGADVGMRHPWDLLCSCEQMRTFSTSCKAILERKWTSVYPDSQIVTYKNAVKSMDSGSCLVDAELPIKLNDLKSILLQNYNSVQALQCPAFDHLWIFHLYLPAAALLL